MTIELITSYACVFLLSSSFCNQLDGSTLEGEVQFICHHLTKPCFFCKFLQINDSNATDVV